MLAIIEDWGPQFRVAFDLMIHSDISATWTSVVAFKGNGGGHDNGEYGDRIPALFYHNERGRLYFTHALNGNKNFVVDDDVDIGTWLHIEIVQRDNDGQVAKS